MDTQQPGQDKQPADWREQALIIHPRLVNFIKRMSALSDGKYVLTLTVRDTVTWAIMRMGEVEK